MFRLLAGSLRAGVATEADPLSRRPLFGFPVIEFARCTGCGDCATVCPTGAIQIDSPDVRTRTVSLSYAHCIACRECLEACPEKAVRPEPAFEPVAHTREQLVRRGAFAVEPESGQVRFVRSEPMAGPSLEESGERLRQRILGRLGRSLQVRQVDAGSCNGCELEIAATANPVYDLQRFGIHFVASPRHADLLLVTGPVTRNMELALRRTWEATPEPRLVVAVGACGCSGGIFGEGRYAAIGGVDRVVPVDVYVPGCPPRPQAILAGLFVAMGRLAARVPGSDSP